jgi:pyruvate/2-oxoglutarate dehydrogenase complex dihydrolipoamide dehydrogenase (E3) component
MLAATSRSTTASRRAQPASGRLATATADAPLPTLPYNDFEIVAANLLDGEQRKVSERILGYALYIDPPLGRVGMTEIEARASGRKLLIGQLPMSRVGRAVERDDTHGFMKVIVDPGTKRIVGAAILGIGGDEAIHGILDIMNAGTYDVLRRAVPIHPTVSELIPRMLGEMTIAD